MIKAYLISDTEVEIVIPECLDSIGNNTEGYGGLRDKAIAFGLTWTESKASLKKTFTSKPENLILVKKIKALDFEALRVFEGITLDKVNLARDQFDFDKKTKK